MLPTITLEEHFLCPDVRDSSGNAYTNFPPVVRDKLLSLGADRIASMDKSGITMQVISHSPTVGAEKAEICAKANNDLYAAVCGNPTRYAGFAMLPMAYPTDAAAELERCITELGFVGALINNHIEGRFYDDDFFWPVFEKAQELDVPLYIHPSFATPDKLVTFEGNYSKTIAVAMAHFGWGWHSETGLHVLRLYAAGVFERFPRLKVIIGHMGEMLPFMMDRVERTIKRVPGGFGAHKRGFTEVWQTNFWITTSGMFSLPPLACLLASTSVDRVLYSVDYPFASNEEGAEFMELVAKSGLVTPEQLEKIAYGNAEQLLGVKVEKK